MGYKAVVFDLDGTLVNTLPDLTHATNTVLEARGFATYTSDEVRMMVGNGTRRLLELASPDGSPKEVIDELMADYLPEYYRVCCNESVPYSGVAELLGRLKAAGIKRAVVSNKPHECVQRVMNHYFEDLCEFCLGAHDGLARKPAPDGVYRALHALGITDVSEAVYVGDSEVDVACARNAGLDCVIVSWGFRDVEALKDEPVTIVDDCDALERVITGTDR
ncbi:MAG: HAD-IA family hydrolase [Atopobiaceae bacterium]|nr:HAD-IA family hydrolase [Atopobiaceae bacterium]